MQNDIRTPSPEQLRAIEAKGPTLIDAPPGSGKTTVLGWRVAHLVEQGMSPFSILAVTFSVRAARELRDRLEAILAPDQVRLITVSTMHALGLRILRESGHLLGYPPDAAGRKPSVIRPERARTTLKSVLAAAKDAPLFGYDRHVAVLTQHLRLDELSDVIAVAKSNGQTPEDYAATAVDPISQAIAWAYGEYQAKLKHDGLVDFDDLVLQPLRLLQQDADTQGYYQSRWLHVLVDEFQDTSSAQYSLIRLIAADGRNLTAIGDPRQSIYAFRGAMGADGFARFRQDFPDAQALCLAENFRSSANIVRVGEAMWGASEQSRAASARRPDGAPVFLLPTCSEFQEAQTVVEQILSAVEAGFACYDECAVLCRTNAQVRLLEKYLIQHKVPYVIVGESALLDYPEVKGLSACLRLALDFTGDSLALMDAIKAFHWMPGSLRKTMRREDPELLAQHVFEGDRLQGLSDEDRRRVMRVQVALLDLDERKDLAPAELMAWIMDEKGLDYGRLLAAGLDGPTRIECANEFVRMARGHATVQAFLNELDALSGYDPLATMGRDQVQLMTLHAAKGLEFKLVFFAGLEEGLVPHYRSAHTERGLLEELRLAYVGMTRAVDVLCLSFARSRNGRSATSSRWLRGLPHVEMRHLPDWRAFVQAAARNSLNKLPASLSSEEVMTA